MVHGLTGLTGLLLLLTEVWERDWGCQKKKKRRRQKVEEADMRHRDGTVGLLYCTPIYVHGGPVAHRSASYTSAMLPHQLASLLTWLHVPGPTQEHFSTASLRKKRLRHGTRARSSLSIAGHRASRVALRGRRPTSREPRQDAACVLDVVHVGCFAAPLLEPGLLHHGHTRDTQEEQGGEGGGEPAPVQGGGEVALESFREAPQSGHGGPHQDLAKVVRMPAVPPEPTRDVPPLVRGVLPEGHLLRVRGRLHEEPEAPQRHQGDVKKSRRGHVVPVVQQHDRELDQRDPHGLQRPGAHEG